LVRLQISLVTEILNVDPWCKYPLTMQVLQDEFEPLVVGAPRCATFAPDPETRAPSLTKITCVQQNGL